VLVDERKARALVTRHPALQGAIPQATGLVGLILLAKRRGQIAAVRPLLDALVRESFRISPTLYQDALRQVGEL
jgi:predicted nucleic acid-binding protein